MDGPCAFERERILKSIKAYGAYWVKPGMTVESWRQDWMGCGGWSNGQFSGDAPSGSTTEILLASWQKERKKLDACMQAKGYEYRQGYEYRSTGAQ
jgi:hypothetical protein